MCGKLSDAFEGDTSSAGEQCKDVCKATQNLPRPQTFFLLPLTYLRLRGHSQEKPVGGQPEYQGLILTQCKVVKNVLFWITIPKYSKMLKDVSTNHLC